MATASHRSICVRVLCFTKQFPGNIRRPSSLCSAQLSWAIICWVVLKHQFTHTRFTDNSNNTPGGRTISHHSPTLASHVVCVDRSATMCTRISTHAVAALTLKFHHQFLSIYGLTSAQLSKTAGVNYATCVCVFGNRGIWLRPPFGIPWSMPWWGHLKSYGFRNSTK